jgi:hypothetical protein
MKAPWSDPNWGLSDRTAGGISGFPRLTFVKILMKSSVNHAAQGPSDEPVRRE